MAFEDEDIMYTVDFIAKYPFLEVSRQYLKSLKLLHMPFAEMLQTATGKTSLELAMYRVMKSLHEDMKPFGKKYMPDHDIISYVIARAIVSCADPSYGAIERLLDYEAKRALDYLRVERYTIKKKVYEEMSFDISKMTLTVTDYIPVLLKLATKKPEYKLVNRDVQAGKVKIEPSEADEILGEKIKTIMREKMPMNVPEDARKILVPIAEEIFGGKKEPVKMDVDAPLEDYPPCMQAIIHDLEDGLNLSHPARFAIVTFLNTIGKSEFEIIGLFHKVKDFNEEKTRYQVRHITGADGGTKYSAPSCATMKTNQLCLSAGNKLCAKVAHPLGYFSAKMKKRNL